MSEFGNCRDMKPEDLTLELFSLQLQLNQVPFGEDSAAKDDKMTNSNNLLCTPISTNARTFEHQMPSVVNAQSMITTQQQETMDINKFSTCQQFNFLDQDQMISRETLALILEPLGDISLLPKSSDEDTVMHDEILGDIIQQSMSDPSSCTDGEKTVVEMDQPLTLTDAANTSNHSPPLSKNVAYTVTSSNPQTPTEPNIANSPIPSTGYYSGHSSRGGPPSPPPEIVGKKKKLKTRHARDSTHTQVLQTIVSRPSAFENLYEPAPTPATPTSTPISSCPSSPNLSGYHSRESTKRGFDFERGKIPRHKRPSHIRAEHKRRNKIQGGLQDLQKIVPSLAENYQSNGKESKSAILSKTVDYCRQLMAESKTNTCDMKRLHNEIETLRAEINRRQSELPLSGAKLTKPTSSYGISPSEELKNCSPEDHSSTACQQMFNDYVNSRSFANWKFWIFGLLIRPLFVSYNSTVCGATNQSFIQSVINWLKSQCSLIALRPAVFNFIRTLSERTSIRKNPRLVPEEVIQSVIAENFPSS